jgi:predicted transcriptional regulator of viral defense system
MVYMKMQDVLDELAAHGKKVFSINDAARIMDKPKIYVSKMLSHNRKVGRIERGKYYLKGLQSADIYEIASQMVFPSYVSMFAAFQYYSLTEQYVIRYSVITIKRHRTVKINGNIIEFITLGKNRFFGYKKTNNLYMATVEKAIIDSLYMNSPPISYVEEVFSEALHKDLIERSKLIKMTLRMGSKAVAKRVYKLLKANSISARELEGI